MARLAVEIGFDMLWLPDHFILKLERHGGEARGVWDCWTTTAGVAAALPGMPIGTMVAAPRSTTPARSPRWRRRIDDISRGNFVLGLGCGWHEDEYHMYGLPFDHRVDRFEEALQIISPLVRTGRATFEGEYYQARDAVNFPRGPQWREGGPPILFGAQQPRMMRLTALYADAWDADWQDDPAIVAERMQALDEACLAVGRDPQGLIRTGGSSSPWASTRSTGSPSGAPSTRWSRPCTPSPTSACETIGRPPAPAPWKRSKLSVKSSRGSIGGRPFRLALGKSCHAERSEASRPKSVVVRGAEILRLRLRMTRALGRGPKERARTR